MPSNPLSEIAPWEILGTKIGIGLLAGWCVGFAARKLTYLMAVILGIFIIALQFLVYQGLVSVNWAGLQEVYAHHVPQVQGLWTILSANIPYTGAFAVGFLAGFSQAGEHG